MANDDSGRSRPGTALAARFKTSIDDAQEAARAAERERQVRLAQARRERNQLFADLAAFGEAVGHFEVTATAEVVVLRHDGRTLRFEATGDADGVTVRGDALERDARLFLHGTLGKWALAVARVGAQEDQRVFFDDGLAWLMEAVFGLTPAEEGEAEAEESGTSASPDHSDGAAPDHGPRRTL